MKKIIYFIAVVLAVSFLAESVYAECSGKEWELGRAIQVAPTGSTNPKWYSWKAKLGICSGNQVVFSTQAYFYHKPAVSELSVAFGEKVHVEPWHTVPEKSRTFYVFEKDWKAWEKKRIDGINGTMCAVRLLTRYKDPCRNSPSPARPSPDAAGESVLTILPNYWQNRYDQGDLYVQIRIYRGDSGELLAKAKFAEVGEDGLGKYAKVFYVKRDIPVNPGWIIGSAPFNLSKEFPCFRFSGEFNPNESDAWAASVGLGGVVPPNPCPWSPENPSPDASNESVLNILPNYWQNKYKNTIMYVQIRIYRGDSGEKLAKAKFAQVSVDGAGKYAVFFHVKKDIVVYPGWTAGTAPFNLSQVFPDYNFSGEFYPGDETDIWAAQVGLKGPLPSSCQQ